MAIYGGEQVGADSIRTLTGDVSRLVDSQRLDPLTRGHLEYGMSVVHQLKAEFDISLELLAGAGQVFAHSEYMTFHGHLLRGQIAMARGEVQDAESHYRRGQRIARKSNVLDPGPLKGAEIMLQELALECGQASSTGDLRTVPSAFMTSGVTFSAIAAASGLAIGQRLRDGRADLALTAVDELLESAPSQTRVPRSSASRGRSSGPGSPAVPAVSGRLRRLPRSTGWARPPHRPSSRRSATQSSLPAPLRGPSTSR